MVGLPFEWRCGLFPFDTGAGLRSHSAASPFRPGEKSEVVPDHRDRTGRPPTRHRRVARQGEDDQGLPRPWIRRRGERRAHPRPPQRGRRGARRSTRARCAGSASTSTTTSSPIYVVNADKKAQVRKLKELLKDADELFLATDEDREGEAIAWHLQEVLKPKVPVHRMVFHEITKDAIQAAVAQPARAEPAPGRRPGDPPHPRPALRLRGLAGAVEEGHAAAVGRPRAVRGDPAGRRARARADRVPLRRVLGPDRHLRHRPPRRRRRPGHLRRPADRRRRPPGRAGPRLRLHRPAQGRRPGPAPRRGGGPRARRRAGRQPVRGPLASSPSRTAARPYAPFRTTTLQQEAVAQAAASAPRRTMQVAQKLYENGFITYMRTDSTTLSETAITAARAQVTQLYGADYLPDKPRTYTGKVKNAQEAHEAIRPSGDRFRTPAETGLTRRRVPALRADLDAHRRLADEGRGRPLRHRQGRRHRPPTAGTPSSPPPARSSPSTAS